MTERDTKRFKLPTLSWSTTISLMVMALLVLLCLVTMPAISGQSAEETPGVTIETLQGRVIQVQEESTTVDMMGAQQTSFRVQVEITKGDRKGHAIEVEYGGGLVMTDERIIQEGDRVLIEHSVSTAGEYYYISDFVRLPFLLLLAAVFVIATALVGRQVGLRSLLGMVYTVLIVGFFILPRLVAGQEPVLICVIGSLLALAPALYLTYGWGWKTHSSVAGLGGSLIFTGLLAAASMNWGRMTGFSSDEATFLVAALDTTLNLQGLLLGGILIGVLGVLDDVCVGQASTTLELKKADPTLPRRELFQRSMRVGRDHVAAAVNTLIMAYVGAALPLLLLFMSSNASLLQTLNRELVAEEILRTLIGSLGLIVAVPITTAVASWVGRLPADSESRH